MAMLIRRVFLLVLSAGASLSSEETLNASKSESEIDLTRNSSEFKEITPSNTSSILKSQPVCGYFFNSTRNETSNTNGSTSGTSNVSGDGADASTLLHEHGALSSVPGNIDLQQGIDTTNQTFLSFNEWRVAKMNQEVLQEEKRTRFQEQISMDTREMEALEDDIEIELSVFSNVEGQSEPEGKVYNHKFNFASLDCAATIVKTNSEASGATSVLTENKDKYLLNPCSAPNKFMIIELCQDILVEEVAIANFEFFSSTFASIRFSVSDLYPVAKSGWRVVGEFDAEDSRDLQSFPIQNPQIWARFLRVEILSHHDNEFYCPVSLIRVHGKTMMDEFKMENTLESPSKKEDPQEIQEVEDESGGQCINEIIEKCNSWPSIDPDNITYLPNFPDTFTSCQSKLVPLKFEEFLRDLNRTHCLSKSKFNNTSFSPSPSFSTEESIFKNIIKRLTSLESNASLTVLYIEEQSKLLSESFEQMEGSQSLKFDNLVSIFNTTIMENLNVLRWFANQLKDQSVRILEEQKLTNDQFTTQYTIKLANLENELKIQQRFAFLVATALIVTTIYFLHRGNHRWDNSDESGTKILPKHDAPNDEAKS